MDVFDAITKRRSIRRFKPNPVREEDIKAMLEAARLAPSTHNAQPWHFLVIRDKALQTELKKAVNDVIDAASATVDAEKTADYQNQKFFANAVFEAPVTISALTYPVGSPAAGAKPMITSGLLSTAAAVMQLNLAAVALGYGCCWSTLPLTWARSKIEAILAIEAPQTIAVLLSVGIPVKAPKDIVKKSVEEITTFK